MSTSTFDWRAADVYLFDIDGTLLNTRDGVHYYSFRNAVRDIFGIDASLEGVPVHGNTDVGILRAVTQRAGISDATFEEKLPLMVEQMSNEVESKRAEIRADICPSIPELLESLRATGKTLGVVTGNFERIGWAKLTATNLKQYFSFGSFSDQNELRTDIFLAGLRKARNCAGPSVRVHVIGDTPSDISAAREARLPIISVATGIYGIEQLSSLHPDICVSCCTELLAMPQVKA